MGVPARPPEPGQAPPFALHQPTSAQAASALLAELGEEARLYAGGTELSLAMKTGLSTPGHLIDVKRIPGIATIGVTADGCSRSAPPPPTSRSSATSSSASGSRSWPNWRARSRTSGCGAPARSAAT